MAGLGTPLAFPLGGPTPTGTGTTLTAAAQRALSRLIQQYKNSPNLIAKIEIFADEAQELWDALAQLYTLRDIDASFGVQLDNIGAIIGEPRAGFSDAEYRLHLKARVLLNKGSGTIPDILKLFNALLPTAQLRLDEWPPAALTLEVFDQAVDPTFLPYLVSFLGQAKDAGVGAILKTSSTDAANTFSFAGGPGKGFNVGKFASAKAARSS